MVHTASSSEIDSLFTWLVMLARRHDIVAIVKDQDKFKVVYSARLDLAVLADLKELDIYHLITHGKTTKSKLTASQVAQLSVYIKECNAQLN